MARPGKSGFGLCAGLVLLVNGCNKADTPPSPAENKEALAIPLVPAKTVARPSDARHLPFEKATTTEPPAEAFRPVDVTMAGKSVGKMYEQIAGKDGLWDRIWFVDAEGRPLHYAVTLKTDLGEITIDLWPDVAPNHVRNFLALAKAGYYDGLSFHATVRQELQDAKGNRHVHEYLEAGCPLGTGEAGYGSIGYWLKAELHDPEKMPKVKHEAGTVGAWHGNEPDTAACKFYVTLGNAPWMDGGYTVFGKVTRGLDIAGKIFARPTCAEQGFPDRPRQPVVIRSTVIHTSLSDTPPSNGQSR